ncbi:hypothetical protein [Xenorhabdus siamensis]|uniref:hypothetical protein n=1 Tax=Xenorhabdus siamensis TaxID=3136254 RepID=UPI0030F411FA
MIYVILQEAIKHAHSMFKHKTANIFYRDLEFCSQSRKTKYSQEKIKDRNNRLYNLQNILHSLYTPENQYKYIVSENEKGNSLVGNCFELSLVAFMYLANNKAKELNQAFKINSMKSKPIYIKIMSTSPKRYNHSFVMLSQIKNEYINRNLPKGAWICDPWANIVCRSEEYNAQWKNTMHQWEAQGKYLNLSESHQLPTNKISGKLCEDRFSPLYKDTYFMVENSEKITAHQTIIKPDGQVLVDDSSDDE